MASQQLIVVYDATAKKHVTIPAGDVIAATVLEVSQDADNGLLRKTDGLYAVTVESIAWDAGTNQLVLTLTDGTTKTVVLPSVAPSELEEVASHDGEYHIPLSQQPKPTGHKLFINGLRQPPGSYTVSATEVVVPDDLQIVTGDRILFEYYPL